MEEENPLLQMPRPLVDTFFHLAEEHATSSVERIRETEKRIRFIAKFIEPPRLVKPKKVSIIIAAVDGSRSPRSSDRLGTRVAVLSAGYKIFKGEALIDEQFYGDAISEGSFEGQIFATLTRLRMLKMERLAALKALEKDLDLLLIDGPFLSSLYPLSLVVKKYAPEASKLVTSVTNATLKLINSNKAIGIIKRSILRAIDGWLLVRGDNAFLTNTKDKHILTRLMPPSSYWAYEWLMEDPIIHSRALFWARVRELKGKEAFEIAKTTFERRQKSLGMETPPKLKRGYIRFSSETPPFEVELPANMSIEEIAERIIPLCNPATGLPFPLDLIDSDISVDRRIAKTFTDEVEARVLDAENPKAVKDYFTGINPQKEE